MVNKNRFLTGVLYLLACLFACLQSVRAELPTYTIDFRKDGTLKAVFDSGLRPTRVGGLEESDCQIGPANLTILLPESSPFHIEIDRADIRVIQDHELHSLDLFGKTQSIPEAVTLANQVCAAMGMDTKGLDEFIKSLTVEPEGNKFWSNYIATKPGIHIFHIALSPLYFFDHVEAHVNISISWERSRKKHWTLDAPITPPPGYENVSMDPPEWKPSGKPPLPAVSLEELFKRADTLNAKKLQEAQAEKTHTSTPTEQPTAPSTPTHPTEPSSPLWLYALLLLIAALLLGTWLYFKSKK